MHDRDLFTDLNRGVEQQRLERGSERRVAVFTDDGVVNYTPATQRKPDAEPLLNRRVNRLMELIKS